MTAEDRSQIRDDAGRDGASDAPSDDTGAREPHAGDAPGHRSHEEPPSERHPEDPRFQRSEEPRFHRPARPGAVAGEGAARAVPPEPGAGDTFGLWLRRQRELREIDLREIADKTKISLRYLKAMEQDRFEVLPAPVFARGFLREYARYVGLNPDEVVNFYLSAHAGDDDEGEATGVSAPPKKSRGTLSRGPLTRGALLILLVVLVVAALVYLFVYQRNSSDQQEAAPPPIAPPVEREPAAAPVEPVAAPPEEPVSTAPLVVTLDFTEQCWVEARVDGSEQVSRLFVAGESLRLEADEQVVLLTLGNADGVEVQVNGRPFPVTASPSGTARGVVIDLAAAGVDPASAAGDGPLSATAGTGAEDGAAGTDAAAAAEAP